MMGHALPRCTPEEIGISSRQVAACIQALSHEHTTMNGFMAARHGKVFAQCWWAPYLPGLVHCNHSLGKSYTATAIGIALAEGRLTLDEYMVDIFATEIAEKKLTIPDMMRRITIRHVLTMTNGMAIHPDMSGDWIANYFRTPMAYEPGTHFAYNSSGSCMLGAIILKRTGENLKAYLTPRLFQKIGIDARRFVWLQFPNGIDAEPGTFSTTEDNLRLAMLYLNGGKWNGEQILDSGFIRDALSVQIENSYAPEQKDGRCGYGYQLWACSIPGVFRFDGGQGQYGIIWPEKDLVIALHEGASVPYGPQRTLDVLYDQLLSRLKDTHLSPDEGACRELRKLEKAQRLQPDAPNALPIVKELLGAFKVHSGVFDPWVAVAPPGNADLFAAFRKEERSISAFTLAESGDSLLLTMDNGTALTASLKGDLTAATAETPFPNLGAYAATAAMTEQGALEIRIHWLNGWFETVLSFLRTPQAVQVTIRKLRLNDADNELITQCVVMPRESS